MLTRPRTPEKELNSTALDLCQGAKTLLVKRRDQRDQLRGEVETGPSQAPDGTAQAGVGARRGIARKRTSNCLIYSTRQNEVF